MTPCPSISVITPALNHGRYIEETILSVLGQQYPKLEHIIIDGASTDETMDIVRRYPHLRWVSEPDGGQTQAINKGIRMSTGEVVAYLNADDAYRPQALQIVGEAFRQDPTIAVLIGDCDIVDEDSRVVARYHARFEQFDDLLRYWEWGRSFCIPQPSTFLHRRVLDRVGLFDESYDLSMDYEMWLRAATQYPFTIVPRTLASFRVTNTSKTSLYPLRGSMEQFRASRRFCDLARWPDRWTIPLQGAFQYAVARCRLRGDQKRAVNTACARSATQV